MQNTWQDLQNKIVEWRDDKLNTSLTGTLSHIVEEIKDLEKNPYDIENIADVYILLMSICNYVGFSVDEIQTAVEAKYIINSSREWNEPDENGITRWKKLDNPN